MNPSISNPDPMRTKLPPSYNVVAVPLVLSVLMSAIVSLISTINGIGFAPDLLTKWLSAWGVSWAIAFPTLLVVLPLVRKVVGLVVEPMHTGK
jgi:hypothetical protein